MEGFFKCKFDQIGRGTLGIFFSPVFIFITSTLRLIITFIEVEIINALRL